MHILFLQVGGTIDKDYPQREMDHGYEFKIGEAAFLSIISRANFAYSWSARSVMRKDSLDMTDHDRSSLRVHVARAGEEHIIITHGTDTIDKTAATLSDIRGKTIVLTGARHPEKFKDSDADFNLGMAVGAVQCLSNGVYVALNGAVLPWNEFRVL